MYKEEAREILKEFLEDCDKTQKAKTKTPLRKAIHKYNVKTIAKKSSS